MKALTISAFALIAMTGAVTAEPLTLNAAAMDQVTAGFSAISIADAEGLVGQGMIVITSTATLSEVFPIATKTVGETSSTLYESLSSSTSSTVTGLLH